MDNYINIFLKHRFISYHDEHIFVFHSHIIWLYSSDYFRIKILNYTFAHIFSKIIICIKIIIILNATLTHSLKNLVKITQIRISQSAMRSWEYDYSHMIIIIDCNRLFFYIKWLSFVHSLKIWYNIFCILKIL